MRTITLTNGAKVDIDGDLLTVLETLYRELTARHDLERSVDFYVTLLGLTPGPRPDLGFPGAWLYANGNVLARRDDDEFAHMTVRLDQAAAARFDRMQRRGHD